MLRSVRMTESKMWSIFRLYLPQSAHAIRIENWVGAGQPDSNICWKGIEVWVENKVASPTGLIKFRDEQIPWIHRRVRSGGRVFVLVYHEGSYLLYHGKQAPDLAENGCLRTQRVVVGARECAERLFVNY